MERRLDLILRAIRSTTMACTLCGSERIRRSSLPVSWWMRLLGVRYFRCSDCGRRFGLALRRSRAAGPPRLRGKQKGQPP